MVPQFHLPLLLLLLLTPALSDDAACLQAIKTSLTDPLNSLASWDFTNPTPTSICTSFSGVTCWNSHDTRLLSLNLQNLHLSGPFPPSLTSLCTPNLEHLLLSGNSLSGPLPTSLCNSLPYLVTLDLSSNTLSGDIPANLSLCHYLNNLNLSSNRFSGGIPSQFSSLTRLTTFSVANNRLQGPIPPSLRRFGASSFAGNHLCVACGGIRTRNLAIIVAAGVFGVLLGLGLWICYFYRVRVKRHEVIGKGKGKGEEVTLFHKPIVKVRLSDLVAATRDFDREGVVLTTRFGATYKAVLEDGSALAVKRLNECGVGERVFRTEMNRLGRVRHPNLVPLLGFCVAEDQRLLVYKDMCNGSLDSMLHCGRGVMALDWPARFRVCLGVARGLAWLHYGNRPAYLHGNVSSSVVLLDEDLDARIIDFGLEGVMDANKGLGEFGYVAPEYGTTMAGTLHGDVYAFGVVLLEVVTRQKPFEVTAGTDGFKGDLVDWVKELSACGQVGEAVDRDLLGKGHDDDILRVLQVACNCVASQPKDRFSMYEAYESLNSMSEDHGFADQYDDFPLIPIGHDNSSPV